MTTLTPQQIEDIQTSLITINEISQFASYEKERRWHWALEKVENILGWQEFTINVENFPEWETKGISIDDLLSLKVG